MAFGVWIQIFWDLMPQFPDDRRDAELTRWMSALCGSTSYSDISILIKNDFFLLWSVKIFLKGRCRNWVFRSTNSIPLIFGPFIKLEWERMKNEQKRETLGWEFMPSQQQFVWRLKKGTNEKLRFGLEQRATYTGRTNACDEHLGLKRWRKAYEKKLSTRKRPRPSFVSGTRKLTQGIS